MKRLILISLLILCSSLLWSLPSTPGVNDWPICFDASAWAALEDQVWAETQRTVAEAVDAAVAPHVAFEKRLKAYFDEQARRLNFWKISTFASLGMVAIVGTLFVVEALLPNAPAVP
jgi:hypothetical protein